MRGQPLRRQLARQLSDERSGQVVFVSHCPLNQNVRYPGGAVRPGGVHEVVDRYLNAGIGICQMPCPEQRAWGGVGKPWILPAFGAGGTWRGPAARRLLGIFVWYTRWVYARLARSVARDIADCASSGIGVVAVVGVGGSPSCGVHSTLDLRSSVGVLTRCPLAELTRRKVTEDAVAAHVVPGRGMFIEAMDRTLVRAGTSVPFEEHDLDALTCDRRGSAEARPMVGAFVGSPGRHWQYRNQQGLPHG